MSKIVLSILGTGQDAGLPHPNCFCENCQRAIENKEFQRTAASLAIIYPQEKKWYLIDATPDLKKQMIDLQIKYELQGKLMESIILTHAHLGHYPGLLFLGKEAINTSDLLVRAGSEMKKLLESQAPWSQLINNRNIIVETIINNEKIKLSGAISIIPVEVLHRNEFSETFGFFIKGPNKKVLYIPDIDSWAEWDQDIYELCKEADVCLLDGTFYSLAELKNIARNPNEIPHPVMKETMKRLDKLTKDRKIYFTHLNHSNPALNKNSQVRKEVESRGFYIADEGMEILL